MKLLLKCFRVVFVKFSAGLSISQIRGFGKFGAVSVLFKQGSGYSDGNLHHLPKLFRRRVGSTPHPSYRSMALTFKYLLGIA